MARLQGSVARNYNKRHRFLGRLWQSRYRARAIDLDDFARLFELAAGLTVRDLAARSRSKTQIRGRIKFATLAISRYGHRVCNVADLIHKHRSSITLWLNKGLFTENTNPEYALRLNQLDEKISRMC